MTIKRTLYLFLVAGIIAALTACSTPTAVPPQAPAADQGTRLNETLAAQAVEISEEEEHEPRQLIIGYQAETDIPGILASLGGATAIRQLPQAKALLVELPQELTPGLALRKLALDGPRGLRYAEPNFRVPAPAPIEDRIVTQALDDPLLVKRWDLEVMNAFAAWETAVRAGTTPSGEGVVIAISDTGIDGTHPDLAGRMVTGWDATGCYATGNYDPGWAGPIPPNADATQGLDWWGWPFVHTHGTHVAGIAAARGNNAHGVAGVAYEAYLMDLKGFCFDSGDLFDLAFSLEAAIFDYDGDGIVPDVINMSWGGGGYSQLLKDIFDMGMAGYDLGGFVLPGYDTDGDGAADRTVTFVASMGNSSNDERFYPAAYSGIISVGATDPHGRADFSTMGNHIAITAPGVDILSTWPSTIVGPDGKATLYHRISGTSMSGPQVAGAAALVKQFHPGLTAFQVRELLQRTANSGAPYDVYRESGAGLLDLKALADALAAIEGDPGLAPTEGGVALVEVTTGEFTDSLGTPGVVVPINAVDVFLMGADADGNEAVLHIAKTGYDGRAYFSQIEPGSYGVLVSGQKIQDVATFAIFPEHRVSAEGALVVTSGSAFLTPDRAEFSLSSTLEVTLRWTGGGDLDLAIFECVPVLAPCFRWVTAKDPGRSGVFDGDDAGADVAAASETYTLLTDHLPTPYVWEYYLVSFDATNSGVGQTAYLTVILNGETFLDDFGPLPVVPGGDATDHFFRLFDYMPRPRGYDHVIPIY